ncbi:MAG: sensor domain-containing diguanylate cyclase [Pseudomonadota bacterium]
MDPTPSPVLRRRSLQADLLRRLAGVALVPAALLGFGAVALTYRSERDNLVDQLAVATGLAALSVETFVQDHAAATGLLARSGGGKAGWPDALGQLRVHFPAIVTAVVIDARGRIIATQPADGPVGTRVADREYFRVPMRTGRVHVSGAFRGRGFGNDPLVAVSAPLLDRGRPGGVVEASIRVDAFTRLRSEALRQRGYEMLILDREDRVVYAGSGLPFAFAQDLSGAPFLGAGRTAATVRHVPAALADGRDAFVARADMQAGWKLLLFAPGDRVTTPLYARLGTMLAMLLLAAAGAALAVRWEMDRFARSLRRVLGPLEALARDGQPAPAASPQMPEELRPLARAIDGLGHRLRSAHQDNAELDRLNRTDALTGTLNRRGLDAALDRLCTGNHGLPLAALLFDIDHFKAYNDRYGHVAGDAALRRVAAAIGRSLRNADDAFGRLGGEEFLALLPTVDAQAALEIAERARGAVESLAIPHADSPTGYVTVSVGVHMATSFATPELLQAADAALYRAKRAGRNRIAF